MTIHEELGLITPLAAAEYLGLSVNTLKNWRLRRVGPDYVKLGSSVFYRKNILADHVLTEVSHEERNKD